jgi:hypothetical protein
MSNLYIAWTNNKQLSDKKAAAFISYLKKYQNTLIPLDDFILDMHSLSSKICMSQCLKCENYQDHNCCCGSSYSMPEVNYTKLQSIARDILDIIPDNQDLIRAYEQYGILSKGFSTSTKGHKEGFCMFSYIDPDDHNPKCAIHKYCLINNLNPTEYKPYICSLFPLEGIILPNGKTVIFCSMKDTQEFTMYFYTLTQRICVNERTMSRASLGDAGNQYLKSLHINNIQDDDLASQMRPAYIEQESILRYFIGDIRYNELLKLLNHDIS